MLSNACFLAKFRFDTAENDPVKNLHNFAKKIADFANSTYSAGRRVAAVTEPSDASLPGLPEVSVKFMA